MRAGSLISWDSRTTHANSANVSDKTRFVAYIAYGITRQDDPLALGWRVDGFMSGQGTEPARRVHARIEETALHEPAEVDEFAAARTTDPFGEANLWTTAL